MLLPPDARGRARRRAGRPACARRSLAICSFDRVRSARGLRRTVSEPRCARPAHEAAAAAVADQDVGSGTDFAHHLLDPEDGRLGPLDARADRQFDVDRDFAFVGLRHQLEADVRQEDDREDEERRAGEQDRRPVIQRLVQEPPVAVVESVEAALAPGEEAARSRPCAGRPASAGSAASSRAPGTSVTATKSDIPSEKMTTTDSCLNMMLETPVRNSSGTNTPMWVRVDARMADQTSSLPSIDACIRSLPMLHVPERVLEHDDGRVDDHADAERQPAEGHRVQRVARRSRAARTCR